MDKHMNIKLRIHDAQRVSVIRKPVITFFLMCSELNDIL
jgi:hypothetical protein